MNEPLPDKYSGAPATCRSRVFLCVAAALIASTQPLGAAEKTGNPCGDTASTLSADSPELQGAVIREVVLDRRQIFDTSIPEENKRLFRLANRYHILTRPSTIRSQLLFAPGDVYSQDLLEESERILRRRSYLYEPSIRPLRLENGMVDVCVVTRDAWSLKPDVSITRSGGETETFFEIEEQNLLGTGAALSLQHSSDVERDSTSIQFSDRQLGSSRVALSALVANSSDGDTLFLDIDRPFFRLDAKRMFGFQLLSDDRERPFYDLGSQVAEFRQRRQFAQVQGGWSPGLIDGWVRRWRLGAAFDENRFDPAADPALPGPLPADRRFVYPYVGFELLEDKFVTTENLDQIARTEDVYLGTRFTGSIGWSAPGLGAADAALLWDAQWSRGYGSPESTLFLLDTGVSGRHQDGPRNRVARARGRLYLRQSDKRLLLIGVSADIGSRLDRDNVIRLGGNSGLRGYPLAYQNGDGRAVITIEQRYYTDWYPFRLLRVGGAVFADTGRIWGSSPVGPDGRGWLSDIGIGLRLTSPRSSSGKILHIDLAFPLDGDSSIDNVQLVVESRRGF